MAAASNIFEEIPVLNVSAFFNGTSEISKPDRYPGSINEENSPLAKTRIIISALLSGTYNNMNLFVFPWQKYLL
jgi:hypothetical protein